MEKVKCIVCRGEAYYIHQATHQGFRGSSFNVYKCGKCRMEFCSPMPDIAVLDRFYENYTDVRASEDISRINSRRLIGLLKKLGITKKSTLLDFGCGAGVFTELYSQSWEKYDLYTFNNPDVLKPKFYDCVTLWGVLEHLIDPVQTLSKIHGYLSKGGHVVLTTVSIETTIPYRHKPPEHLTYWTNEAIEIGLRQAGFKLLVVEQIRSSQKKEIYMKAVLRTVPSNILRYIDYGEMPAVLNMLPTNEILVIGEKIT